MNGSKPGGSSGSFQAPRSRRRRPGLRVSSSPSPRPSPRGEGEPFVRALGLRPSLVGVCLRNERQRSGDCKPRRPNFPALCQRSPSPRGPRGEGWGEGEGSKIQSQTHGDSRNCQISRVPRQSRPALELSPREKASLSSLTLNHNPYYNRNLLTGLQIMSKSRIKIKNYRPALNSTAVRQRWGFPNLITSRTG
jgi:hypothetical protein